MLGGAEDVVDEEAEELELGEGQDQLAVSYARENLLLVAGRCK